MKLKNIFAFSLLASLFATGCVKEMPTDSFKNITVDKTFLYIGKEGGSVDLTVNADEAWYFVKNENWPKVVSFNKDEKGSTIKAKHDYYGNLINEESDINASKTTDSWLSASVMEGQAGETKVTFTAAASEGGREITLAIVCGTSKQHFIVRQGSLEAVAATCEEIIAGPDAKTYRAKGTVTSIASTTYGNWYLKDDTGEIYIYGTLDANGAEKNFESLNIEVGDLVEVEGPKTTYNGTVELVNVTVLSISKSLLKICTEAESYVKEEGDYVAKVAYKGRGLDYSIPEECKDWITVTGISSYAGTPSKLEQNPADTALVSFHLAPNPAPAGDRKGKIVFTSAEGKNSTTVDFEIFQKGSIVDATVAEFIAAEESLTNYRVKGVVRSISASSKYHNADLIIAGGLGETVKIFRAKTKEGNIEDLGIAEGDLVTFVGLRSSNNGVPEMAEGGVYESHSHYESLSVAEFLAKPVADDLFAVSGEIIGVKDLSESYNNVGITIKDGDNELYMHRVTTIDGSNVAKLDPKVGAKITVVGARGEYKGSPQMAQYGKIFNYEAPSEGGDEGGEEGGDEGGDEGEVSVLYTLDATDAANNGKDNSYAGSEDITINGITWNVTGNTTINPWRIGGKKLNAVDREVFTKTPYEKALTKIVVTLGTKNITLNSCKLLYSANADFSGATEVPFEYAEGAIELANSYPANCYYKLVFNCTETSGKNMYVQLSKIEFYGK